MAPLKLRVSSYSDDRSQVAVCSFFNGVNVDPKVDFKVYQNRKHKENLIVHGETEFLDYDGHTNEDDSTTYCVGLYDPVHRSLDLFDHTAMLTSTITSRKRKSEKGPKVKQTGVQNNIKRNLLGETFGTKKAKKAITQAEKNRIDSETLESNQLDIIDTLNKSTSLLPSRDELKTKIAEERPIPQFDEFAKNVDDIYPLENIISKKELQFIRVDAFLKEDPKTVLEQFPYTNNFLTQKITNINKDVTNNKKQTYQVLYYLSLLLGVYNNRRCHNKAALSEALKEPSDFLIDSILKTFTISKTGSFGRSKDRSFMIDPANEDKLLCYILVLILRLNNYLIEISPLSSELSLKPSKLTSLLKAVGCQIKNSTKAQAEAFGISKTAAGAYKIASLKVPFKVPEVTSGARRR